MYKALMLLLSLSPAELLLNDELHTGLKHHFRSFLFFIIVGLTEKFFLILACITYCCKIIRSLLLYELAIYLVPLWLNFFIIRSGKLVDKR